MSKIQPIAAIDIGTTKIVAIVGTLDDKGKVNVLGFGEAPSKGVIRGSVQNVGEVSAAIKEAAKKCQEYAGVTFKSVFVGIAGQNIRTNETSHSRFVSSQIMTQADIDELTNEVYNLNREADEEVIHVIPQYYMVDNNRIGLSPVGCSGKKLTGSFKVVVGRANAVQKIRQAINMSGLSIAKIVLQSVASADAVLSNDDKEVGTLVADIGAGTTDVAIYHDKVLRDIAVIPFGGNAITNDIKTATLLTARQAETLKLQYAAAFPDSKAEKTIVTIKSAGRTDKEISLSDLVAVTNARAEEIVAGIAHILQKSGYDDRVTQISITGGGSRLKNLTTLINYHLDNRSVNVVKPRNFTTDSCPKLNSVEYSTAIGLLVKGFEYITKLMAAKANEPQQPQAEQQGKPQSVDSKPDTKSDKKPAAKKRTFLSWFNDTVKNFFSDDAEASKL